MAGLFVHRPFHQKLCQPTGVGFLRRVDYATAAGYLRPNTDRITGERHAYLMSG
jgi:hypothetical protein